MPISTIGGRHGPVNPMDRGFMDRKLGWFLALFAAVDLTVVVMLLLAVFRAYHSRQLVKRQLVTSISLVLIFFIAPLIFLTAMYVESVLSPSAPPAAAQ
jgi:hypothetical protein